MTRGYLRSNQKGTLQNQKNRKYFHIKLAHCNTSVPQSKPIASKACQKSEK